MKINPFQTGSFLYPFRWYIIFVLCVAGLMLYADLTGWRLLQFSEGQQWNADGPGYHK
ncbi:MAG TPA: hypothetical protein VEX65_08915 [Flavisolibacter sp.]|jgi:hypothetical protein|nr:hypothetical protein [Flavisolibacter sp.]